MSALKLTVYHGERDRIGGVFLADRLSAIFARHELLASVVMRGAAGFGAKQHLRTDRLLTLSEDLPMVSVGVDDAAKVEGALADIAELEFDGLVTLERAAFEPRDGSVKLTAYLARGTDHRAVVAALQARGVVGASVLLGVDGTVRGARRRARFLGRNADVPAMVVSVGDAQRLAEVGDVFGDAVVTFERVRIGEPERVSGRDERGLPLWQMLTVYGGGDLVAPLRAAGAAGATCLRGVWGFHGDHAPHGDRLRQLRRRVPMLTIAVDEPAAVRRLFPVVSRSGGLVTVETVPAAGRPGELRLARP